MDLNSLLGNLRDFYHLTIEYILNYVFYVPGSVMDILSKEPKDSVRVGLAPATELKSGSVMDVLNKGKSLKILYVWD